MKCGIISFFRSIRFLIILLLPGINGLQNIVKIGGLFDTNDNQQEVAFRYAVDKINNDRKLLPHTRLSPQIEKIDPNDSFLASKRVCHLLNLGVAAIFGPQSNRISNHVQSICDAMEVPHIETRWDFRLRRDDYSVNLYPHPTSMSKAYAELVEELEWTQFTILYEDNEGLVRLQDIIKSTKKYGITFVRLNVTGDYRPLLKEVKMAGDKNVILDCKSENIGTILKQAQQIGMMSDSNSYLITSLDLGTVDLEDYKYGGTYIVAFRMVDPQNLEVKDVVKEWIIGDMKYGRRLQITEESLKTETALMYDAVHIFAQSLQKLDNSSNIRFRPLNCDGMKTPGHGYSLINYMKLEEILKGLTGEVKFDTHGFRTNFHLDIVELTTRGLLKAGTWGIFAGINFTRVHDELFHSNGYKTLIVTSFLSEPYMMYKQSKDTLYGNDRYEGYGYDLIEKISEIVGFNYTIREVADNNYGRYDKETKRWNGMIGELKDGIADLAIADLSTTYERLQAVDFTMPFMYLGISILYVKPTPKPPKLFSFLDPLSPEVWLYITTAYIGVSLVLFILARFTPYEWESPHPCDPEPDHLESQFSTLKNCMWFGIGSLMQQGCDYLPKAVSTRMVAGMWWFFTLIMISSYTANLAAFLTVVTMESPIDSAEDLAKQSKIKYGSVKSGSTYSFFQDSEIDTYRLMGQAMKANPSVFVNKNIEGLNRVREEKGGYAFLMESTSIEYNIERYCDLAQVGDLLDSKGYGIALQPNSKYKSDFNSAILKLQEENVLHQIKTKWWKQKRGGGQCSEGSKGGGAEALTLQNVGGVFVVLLGGMAVATLIAAFEFLWNVKEITKEEGIPFWREVKKELRFALLSRRSTKPVRKKPDDGGEGEESGPILGGSPYSPQYEGFNFSNNEQMS